MTQKSPFAWIGENIRIVARKKSEKAGNKRTLDLMRI